MTTKFDSDDFEEVNSTEYAVYQGERICYWDSGHKQHFFIKKRISEEMVLEEYDNIIASLNRLKNLI